jgi:plasmid stabilization system protein ParE
MNVRYHPMAREEVIDITAYYARIRPTLAAEFLAELNAAIELIAANPLVCEEIRPGVRRCLIDRFPYGVYYRIPDAETVRIILVRHHSRRPGYGMRRI